jgi:hypothetical protein
MRKSVRFCRRGCKTSFQDAKSRPRIFADFRGRTLRRAHVGVNQKRRVAGRSRPRSLLIAQRHDARLQRGQALQAEHPFWGDRRSWAELRFVEPWPVHKKRGWRLMRAHHLVVPTTLKRKAKRTPTGSTPRATKPHAWGGIDMTTLWVEGFGWVSIGVVRDW